MLLRSHRLSSIAFIALALPIIQLPAQATRAQQAKTAAETILAADLMRDVTYLASDAMKGRYTASPGFDTAAAYVISRIKSLGLKPMGDKGTYIQSYTVTRSTLDTTKVSGSIGKEPLKWGDDFIVNNFLIGGVREANVIYVGNGTRIFKQNIDPYKGFDIKGKWVLVNAPAATAGRGGGRGSSTLGVVGIDYTTINDEARHRGALGILLVPTQALLNGWNRRATTGRDLNPSVGIGYSQYPIPRVLLSEAALRKLLAGTPLSADAVLKADSIGQYPASVNLGNAKKVKINFAAITEDIHPYNVVAMIEGSDPVLRNQWISIASHLDGAVGRGTTATGDSIYNAADDNGSGSSGNLAVAMAMMKGPRPKRSILLLWDSGEEVGLWGTRHLAYTPYGDKLVAHINTDMIARSANSEAERNTISGEMSMPGEVFVAGPHVFSTVMDSIVNLVNEKFDYVKINRHMDDANDKNFYPRTDSAPYAERGIPFMDIQTGLHADYHRQTDEVSKLDPVKFEGVARTVYLLAWFTAESAQTPRFDKPVPPSLWFVTPKK